MTERPAASLTRRQLLAGGLGLLAAGATGVLLGEGTRCAATACLERDPESDHDASMRA